LRLLFERYGVASKLKDGLEKEDLEDLMGALLELRGQCRKLQWYGEVNRRGFVKITKKLDKKIESSTTQNRYLTTRVDPKQFATNNRLTMDMRNINEWLSSLNDVKISDDASSIHSGSSHSLRRMGSKGNLQIPSTLLEAMDSAVRNDDSAKLLELYTSATATSSPSSQRGLLLDLLQRAIAVRAFTCISDFLSRVPTLDPEDDMNKRNCLHRMVIAMGRSRALEGVAGVDDVTKGTSFINAAQHPVRAPTDLKVEERDPESNLSSDDDQARKLLVFVLDRLNAAQRPAVRSKDIYGRTPLHYAAQYGLVIATEILMSRMQDWQLFDITEGIDSETWQDEEGFAPLHLAVIGGHYRTSKALLMVDDWHKFTDHRLTSKHVEKSSVSLVLATKSNFHKIVKLLVDAGVDINFQDEQGETALHTAARFGHEDCARALLANTGPFRANVEITEKSFGWTPLFIACVNGHLPIVKLLIDAGAQTSVRDSSTWHPQEHAALRGHIDVARYLASLTPPPSRFTSPEIPAQMSSSPPKASSFGDKRSHGVPKDATNGHARLPEPMKAFGHRYLTDETMVLVSLGTLDEHKNLGPINLDSIALADAHATQLDTALSLVVSAQGANGESQVIDLPIQEEISTSPITFTTKDPSKVKLLFDLVPTYAGSKDKVIARAVALLSSIKLDVGTKRMSLQTDLSVPLIAGSSLEVIGSINFNFLIITPFKHPKMSISEEKTYWTKSSTKVIGHRGLGKNMTTKTSLQLGENTIQSFITAANLGASYVEFDVQMTKDLVPVIYHDFLVSETGADVPVHTLTLEQFLALSETPKSSRFEDSSENLKDLASTKNGDDSQPRRNRPKRSYSVGGPVAPDQTKERMKHTRDFKKKGFKANSRGDFIQSPFTTLEEMFRTLPEEVGFNIEMKYPMLFESVAEEMDTYAVELNSFVDTVLAMVYDRRGKRNIVFSSFHPDICLLLTFKQPSIPVLFLTDAGVSAVGDIRASSLQEAVRFASRWSLLGIVSAAEPLVLCPRLIGVVQSSSLVCVSYGTLNNDPLNSNLQAQAGIDAVIVDSVARVRKGLTEAEYAAAKEAANAKDALAAGLAGDCNGMMKPLADLKLSA
jgi:glycerophosphodiester phosphodiesterase